MPQKITKSVKSMVEAAKREIEEIEAADAVKLRGRDDVVLVDLRDPRELERDGKVPGAFRMTRGMLEFWIDPESPYFKPCSARTRSSCSFAPAACARRSRPRPRRTWASSPSPTCSAASRPGRRPAGRRSRVMPGER